MPARNPAIAISTQSRFDARFDQLWTAASEGFDFIADRGAGYLNWRYSDPAGGDSLLRVATLGEELIGYAVLRLSGDLPLIADLLVRPGHESALSVILADALSQVRQRDLRQLACPLPRHHPYRAALLQSGLQDAGGDYRFQYRPHGNQPERLVFLGSDPEARIHVIHR